MKKIEAIIQTGKLSKVHDELVKNGAIGMTVTEVKGCGKHKGHTSRYRGAEYKIDLLQRTKVEVVVKDDELDKIIKVITQVAKSEEAIGDGEGVGIVFVSDVQEMIRIPTNERGEDAISCGSNEMFIS